MKKAITILFVFIFLGIIPKAFCADVAKIGVFNFQKILTESSAGKMTQKKITNRGNELQNKLKSEKRQLDELNKSIEKESYVLSPEKLKEKQRAFRIRVNDLKKMQEDFAQEFKTLEVKLINEIQKEVFEITDEIGKKEGYLIIFERKTAGIVYHPAQLDITNQIIKKYNLKISKKK